jgi:hypothetical protein
MASNQGWTTMRGEALRPSTHPALDGLLLRLGMPVLQERDRRGGAVEHRVDQEAPVGGDVVLPPYRPL